MADEVEEQEPKKSKLPLIIIAVTVNVAIAGVIVVMLMGSSGSEAAPAPEAKVEPAPGIGPLIALDDFIVNVEGENGVQKYLKAALSIELKNDLGQAPFEEAQMLVRNEVLMYLSSLSLEQIKTVKQKKVIQETLKKRINKRLKGDLVAGVYFTEFVTQ